MPIKLLNTVAIKGDALQMFENLNDQQERIITMKLVASELESLSIILPSQRPVKTSTRLRNLLPRALSLKVLKRIILLLERKPPLHTKC